MNAGKLLPQYDRGRIKTPTGFFRTLFRLHDIGQESVLPAIVREYDWRTGTAVVQPLADKVCEDADGNEVLIPRAKFKVRVVRFAHGGFSVDAPLFKGDTGWLVAADRNCKTAISENATVLSEDQSDDEPENKGNMRPDDNSLASFAWGFFIPDSWAVRETKPEGLGISDRLKMFGIYITDRLARLFGKGGAVEVGENGVSVNGNTEFKDGVKFGADTYFGDQLLGVKTMSFKDSEKSVKFLASEDVEIGGGGGGGSVSVDGKSIDKVYESSDAIQVLDFDTAAAYSVAYKGNNGKMAWGAKAITNIALSNGNKTLTITYADGTSTVFSQPTVPTVGNGKLTITVGGTAYTFTANQATNTSITIPSGGGDVTVTGTDDVPQTGNDLKIASESNSNVTAKVTKTADKVTITLGVYYV